MFKAPSLQYCGSLSFFIQNSLGTVVFCHSVFIFGFFVPSVSLGSVTRAGSSARTLNPLCLPSPMHSLPSSFRCHPHQNHRCKRHQNPALNLRHGCHHPQTGQCAMAKTTIDEVKVLVIMRQYPPAPHVGTQLQICVAVLMKKSTVVRNSQRNGG